MRNSGMVGYGLSAQPTLRRIHPVGLASALERALQEPQPVLAPEHFAAAKSDAIGAIYSGHAQQAVDANVIGSPCYVLDGEVFWGQDRLALLESALKSGRKAYRMDATT